MEIITDEGCDDVPLSVFLFIFIFLISLILVALLFLRVTVVVQAFYQENFMAKLHIRIFGKNIKTVDLYPRHKHKKQTGGLSPVLHLVKLPQLKNVETAFFLDFCVGMSDAASTAVTTGILQGFINSILLLPENLTTMKVSQVEVTPSYNNPCFIFNGICIARSGLGNIILGAIHYKKMKGK